MRLKAIRHFIFMAVALLILNGCAPSIRTSVIDVRSTIDRSGSERVYRAITLALLDKGFDLKIKDTAMRLITTEYQKYDSVSGWPPFDFYLKIKAVVRDSSGGSGDEIVLWPTIKEQNRLNMNAFTEHPLILYSTEDTVTTGSMTSRSEAMRKGQLVFRSLLQAIADALSISVESFRYSTQQIELHGM